MNSNSSTEFAQLAIEDQHQVDQLCDEFESALRSGEDVQIEDYYTRLGNEPARRTALNQLIGLELYHRRAQNEALTRDSYSARFPAYQDAVAAAFDETSSMLAPEMEIGPFRIVRQIGGGGMGIVYLARDQKLDRDVALKVLPAALAEDEQWLRRFHCEARILAGLTHPHIATLYGFEELQGLQLCVMEYVPGKTLARMLEEDGGIRVEEVDRIFSQISDALEHAHSRGVIHRDLKPANILIQPNGTAKLLDFGLATSVPAFDSNASDLTDVEALRMAGTLPYMSPEQIRGRSIDKRADNWAFGCCLYEALTANRAFHGDSLADVVSAILHQSPDWDQLPKETPRNLRFVLRRSLEKDVDRRLRDIGDAWLADEVMEDLDSLSSSEPPTRLHEPHKLADGRSAQRQTVGRKAILVPWLLFGAAAIGCLVALLRPARVAPVESIAYDLTLPPTEHLTLDQYGPLGEPRRSIALSPNGKLLAYIAAERRASTAFTGQHIFVKRLGEVSGAVRLDATEGAYHVFFSPNNRWIGFFSNGMLKKITATGESYTELCEVSFPIGGTWSDDGNIYIGDSFGDRLVTIHQDGGPASTIHGEWYDKNFQWIEALPEGKGLLSSKRGAGLTHVESRSGKQHVLLALDNDVHPLYCAGRLFYAFDGRLMASSFDVNSLAIASTSVSVCNDVRTGQWGVGQYTISNTGTLAYIPGKSGRATQLARISQSQLEQSGDQEVEAEPLVFTPEDFGNFTLSPDDMSIAIEVHKQTTDIWRYDLQSGNRTRLTFRGNNRHPVWSPHGKSIVFSSDRDGGMNLFLKSALNESAEATRLTPKSTKTEYVYSWDRDNGIGYREMSDEGHAIKSLQLSAGGVVTIRPLTDLSYMSQPQFSPDGDWVVYTHWQAGDRAVVRLQRYPGSGDNWAVSGADGGEEAVWSQRGDKIVYRIDASWMSVDFTEPTTPDGPPQLSTPQHLFSGNYINVSGMSYDITAKGDFILLHSLQDPKPNRIRVIHNWFGTLPPL